MLEFCAVRTWLSARLCQFQPTVVEAFLFGSILAKHSEESDVDVLIIFNEWDVREVCSTLKAEFTSVFGYPMHLQLFHVSQKCEMAEFLDRAGIVRRVI